MSQKRTAPWRSNSTTPKSRRRVDFTSSTPQQRRDVFDFDEDDDVENNDGPSAINKEGDLSFYHFGDGIQCNL